MRCCGFPDWPRDSAAEPIVTSDLPTLPSVMASSSVSQESLDMDDFDTMARRNRIRTHRGRAMPHRSGDRVEAGGDAHDREGRGDHQNGDTVDNTLHGGGGVGGGVDHESPTRSAAARLKEKTRSRANHLHKGKLPKDKRKLREKRRSTGVVHLPSTESTGDSLDDDDDDDENMIHETKKNTTFNEATATSSHHHHHHHHAFDSRPRGNKSPSDLEADLEDNQDYDSTVSHSETNLTLIGRSESSDAQMNSGLHSRQPPTNTSKFSPEASRAAATAFKYGGTSTSPQQVSSDQDSNRTPPPSASTKSSVSSIVARYTQGADSSAYRDTDTSAKESDSPRGLSSYGASKDLGSGRTERSYGGYLSSRFHERDREASSAGEMRSDVGTGGSRFHASRFHYQSPRPFISPAPQNNNTENTAQLERQLEKEKEENKKLQQQLEQKDRRIAELERQVALLNKECDELDEDNLKLQEENKALIRAMSQLSSNV